MGEIRTREIINCGELIGCKWIVTSRVGTQLLVGNQHCLD